MVQVTNIKKVIINKNAAKSSHEKKQSKSDAPSTLVSSGPKISSEIDKPLIERRSGKNRRQKTNNRLKRFDPRNKNDRRKNSVIYCCA